MRVKLGWHGAGRGHTCAWIQIDAVRWRLAEEEIFLEVRLVSGATALVFEQFNQELFGNAALPDPAELREETEVGADPMVWAGLQIRSGEWIQFPNSSQKANFREACRAREAHRFKSSFPVLRGLTPIKKRSALIEHAINYRKDISFSYVDAHGNRSSRVVTPFCLFQWEGEWGPAHLFKGHCHLDDAERIFRLSRMTYLKIVE
jgi:hypothetical protein